MSSKYVRIISDVEQKYVVVSVQGLEGKNETYLWGNPKAAWHNDIVRDMEGNGFTISQVLGGGKIQLLCDSKEIYFYGTSSRYGKVDPAIVQNILKDQFPDHDIFNKKHES